MGRENKDLVQEKERVKKDLPKKRVGNCSATVNSKIVIDSDLLSPSGECEQDDTPLRSIFCLKNREKMMEIEEKEECFILGFDPYDVSEHSVSRTPASADSSCDLSVISEKGQVASRDYPHSRHDCLKCPFEKTPHRNYCEQCYCFVCDSAAPCNKWAGISGHCHAIDNECWRLERKQRREQLRNVGRDTSPSSFCHLGEI